MAVLNPASHAAVWGSWKPNVTELRRNAGGGGKWQGRDQAAFQRPELTPRLEDTGVGHEVRACSDQEMGTEGRGWPWQARGCPFSSVPRESRRETQQLPGGEKGRWAKGCTCSRAQVRAACRVGSLSMTRIPLSSWCGRGWGRSTLLPAATASSCPWVGGTDGGRPCQG